MSDIRNNRFYREPEHARPVDRNELMSQARGEVTSQATTIEQSRAIAQVQGALVVAQNRPRDRMAAATRMREACDNHRLAERAFFSYPRGRTTVTGASVHLATELALCWGNLDYGIVELRRDDAKHESEMQAYAWDLETNLRVTNSFIVPHKRDKQGGGDVLTEMRDIYENNANQGARRLRECIFRALPGSYREEAQELCRERLQKGTGEPIEAQREKLLAAYGELGIAPRRIEKRIGKKAHKFTAYDLGELRISYRSIKNGEADAGELFPDESGAEAAAELARAQRPAEAPKPPAEAPTLSSVLSEAAKDAAADAMCRGPDDDGQPALLDDLPIQTDPDPAKIAGLSAKAAIGALEVRIRQADATEADRLLAVYRQKLEQAAPGAYKDLAALVTAKIEGHTEGLR